MLQKIHNIVTLLYFLCNTSDMLYETVLAYFDASSFHGHILVKFSQLI